MKPVFGRFRPRLKFIKFEQGLLTHCKENRDLKVYLSYNANNDQDKKCKSTAGPKKFEK